MKDQFAHYHKPNLNLVCLATPKVITQRHLYNIQNVTTYSARETYSPCITRKESVNHFLLLDQCHYENKTHVELCGLSNCLINHLSICCLNFHYLFDANDVVNGSYTLN
ncbi:unnamed protein product [Schistosoma rodhaini]|uniref:Uncharacterized protein n=1 Tax=Schistosoma rodhaini TaxID=6188 RepID=A0AA85FLI7_9TREM|nr:unnamed protein product [Schistosoma rodhaini]